MAEEKTSSSHRTVYIQPSTGGQIEVKVSAESSVACLKKAVANRLKVPRDRIVLLHKNRQLVEGTLEDNKVVDGSRLILLPSVETGIAAQRPEQCVMQALETLTDTQVDSFLAGHAPLNLTMRLGDHMMFIQLQLSTVDRTTSSSKKSSSRPKNLSSPLPTPPTTPTTPDSPSAPLLFPNPTSSSSSVAPLSPPPSPKLVVRTSQENENPTVKLNTRALAEASRNLTHTLRQLSSAALNKKMSESCDGRCCSTSRQQGGAVIESMFHHGRGVYSGTFSGTLSPSLQDKDGRPRRDIGTIIHILNDLLGASAHCRPSTTCLCPTSSSSAPSTTTSNNTTTTTASSPSDLASTSTTTPSLRHVLSSTLQVNVEGEQKEQENDALRKKIEQIQSMLDERRQKRKARRSAPYPSVGPGGKVSPAASALRNTDIGDQTMAVA